MPSPASRPNPAIRAIVSPFCAQIPQRLSIVEQCRHHAPTLPLPPVVDFRRVETDTLKGSNVFKADGQRTSVRLNPSVWRVLDDFAHRLGVHRNIVVAAIDHRRGKVPLTRAIEIYLLEWLAAGRPDAPQRLGS